MPAGTLHIADPSQPLAAEFYSPCDFIHFHVSSDYLRKRQDAAGVGPTQPSLDLNDLIIRDPLAELLGLTLVGSNHTKHELYAESVGKTLVMHIARMEFSQPTASPLTKWRLKRVQAYVNAHLDEAMSLPDLAAWPACRRCISLDSFVLRRDIVPTIICSTDASKVPSRSCQARIGRSWR
jgi:AraC family transcriptional regulator